MEAFSDGVIAIAITLLTLDIRVPLRDEAGGATLVHRLAQLWPNYLAFATSFAVVGILWINHHAIFEHIDRTDYYLVLINTVFLFTVAALPFTTALLAEYIRHDGERTATLVYTGWFLLVAISFNRLWWYARHAGLTNPESDQTAIDRITARFRLGIPLYSVLVVIAFFFPMAALIGMGVMALLYALPNQSG
jgi:uncharacterized membrane protein